MHNTHLYSTSLALGTAHARLLMRFAVLDLVSFTEANGGGSVTAHGLFFFDTWDIVHVMIVKIAHAISHGRIARISVVSWDRRAMRSLRVRRQN
jgi:hypothetical protein